MLLLDVPQVWHRKGDEGGASLVAARAGLQIHHVDDGKLFAGDVILIFLGPEN